jgi:hypothetical protein
MRSGWFFGTPMWNEYLQEYAKTRPECLHEWKSSPLADDHDLSEAIPWDEWDDVQGYTVEQHQTQVIDLRTHKWSDVRKSYRGIINKAKRNYSISVMSADVTFAFQQLHAKANGGQPRNDATYSCQRSWLETDNGLLVMAFDGLVPLAAAYWILYRSCAYYMSGPSIADNVQHAVIWRSLEILKRGYMFAELGQIGGETEKEKKIGIFKTGFGGEAKPFTIVRRTS